MDALTLEDLMRTTHTDGYPEDLLPLANAIEAAVREQWKRWVHPDDVQALTEYADKLARKRARRRERHNVG